MTIRGRWSAALAARAAARFDCPSRIPATVRRTRAHSFGAQAAPHSSTSPQQRRSRRHLALVHLRHRPSSSWEAERNSANCLRSAAVSSTAALVSFFVLAIATASLVPAARCARLVNLVHPRTRGGRSADRRPGAAAPGWPAASHKHSDLCHAAGRGACEAPRAPQRRDARLSALHRGDFRPGAALPSRAFPPDPCSELLAARS
jgi:hypothetical protein